MNELLHKHGCANVFSIPEGLKELMSDISREVLRDQPAKIYDFIANYLSVLLITREHGILAVRVLDDLCDCRPSVAEHLTEIGLTGEQAFSIADIIKDEVESVEPVEGKETVKEAQIIKRILAKVVLDEMLTAKVCQVARNTYREYWYRKKLLEKRLREVPDEPWEIAAERTLQIYKSTKPSFTELSRAAEKIQAAYRGYHVRRNLLTHLKPKKKKRGPKVDLPGPPLDIAASREIDLGPLIDITVHEDDVKVMFDEHATEELGLPYDPQKAITHVEDMEYDDDVIREDRSKAASRISQLKSAKSLVKPSQMMSQAGVHPVSKTSQMISQGGMQAVSKTSQMISQAGMQAVSQSAVEDEAPPPRRSRLASHVPEPTVRPSRMSGQISEAGLKPSQLQAGHLSFSEIPAEVIQDEGQGTPVSAAPSSVKEASQEPSEVPEDIPDDRTEGDGESAPTASAPSTAPETDVSEVEDVAEDMATSGEEEG